MADPPFDVLRPFERFAFRVMRWLNLSWPGALWQRFFVTPFVGLLVGRRLRLVGLERLDVIEAGAPIDLSGFPKDTRLSHHKRCADLFAERIAELGQEEKKLSATSPAAPP